MKNFTLLVFVILFLSSCAKEDITPLVTESPDGITRLYVKVTFKDCYSQQNCGNGYDFVPVANAAVFLYKDENSSIDDKNALTQGLTDGHGLAKFDAVEDGQYFIEVTSSYGKKDKKVVVEAGKITRIEIRY